jgi:pescadillo protein
MSTASALAVQVIDRPTIPMLHKNRQYVQPQWVFDSANARVLVRGELYAPGAHPPPHLSPFVDEEEEGYVPEYGRQIKQLQVGWWWFEWVW